MNKIEEVLKGKKEDIQMADVPSELEDRLRNALERAPRRRFKNRRGLVAAVLVFDLLF